MKILYVCILCSSLVIAMEKMESTWGHIPSDKDAEQQNLTTPAHILQSQMIPSENFGFKNFADEKPITNALFEEEKKRLLFQSQLISDLAQTISNKDQELKALTIKNSNLILQNEKFKADIKEANEKLKDILKIVQQLKK